MAAKSGSLDYWRNYFRTANSDIFDIIDKAISVAATDCPKEFRLRRDRIAEHLFSCKLARCSGCDQVKVAAAEEGDDGRKACFDTGSKESKVNSSGDDHGEMNVNQVSNYSYGEAEALTDEIEEASQIVEEVLRIKEILDDSQYQSEQLLYDSLRKLQLMALSVDILKSTEIGKAVNGLRKHGSKRVCHLARDLIDLWKEMVDEWVNATKALAEGTPESVNPSVVDDEEEEEEGLPSPPMDDFFATQPTAIELSQFFDGMDDDGNPRISGEFNKNRGNGRKPSMENQNIVRRKQQSSNDRDKGQQMKKQEANVRLNKHTNPESGPGRPPKVNMERRSSNETKLQQRGALQRRPLGGQQDCSDEAAKLEATKRKLQERYQQAENAKRQRTIQVMELHDIPKQGLGHRNPHVRPGNNGRPRANGRR